MQRMKAGEIDIATVHDIDGTGFGKQQIERMHVGQFAVRHVNEARDVAAQVEQGVHLHRRLGGAEMSPRKDRQAQVDGCRIQGVDRIGQVETKILRGVQLPRLGDQPLGQIRVDAPVARLRKPGKSIQRIDLSVERAEPKRGAADTSQDLQIGKIVRRAGLAAIDLGVAALAIEIAGRRIEVDGRAFDSLHRIQGSRCGRPR